MRKINKITGRWIKAEAAMKPTKTKKKKAKEGPKPKTYVVMLLDKSASMWSSRDKAIKHFNGIVDEIKTASDGQDVNVSLVTFNHFISNDYFNEDIEFLKPIGYSNYSPSGRTALNDAIGLTIDKMKIELNDLNKDHVSVLFFVLTDGLENASRIYQTAELQKRLKNLQSSGRWTFTYMGTDHDADAVAQSLNIPQSNTLAFDRDKFVEATYSSRVATNDYFQSRRLGKKSTDQFYDKKI